MDQQTIWRTDVKNYTGMPDMAAGGRIAFDGAGHVFISIGMKGGSEFAGIQDLGLPYGKIHRVNDDGSIPADNPLVAVTGALPSIWTYGHRRANSPTRAGRVSDAPESGHAPKFGSGGDSEAPQVSSSSPECWRDRAAVVAWRYAKKPSAARATKR